jgi:AcrR family transcriptional regulator
MPKIVDWDARRDEILSATWRVIARDGIARPTIRAIAREAGCSRGILAHYFDDKADILGSALVMSHRRVVARMEARAAGLTGLAALRVIMLEALPLDGERDLEAQIEISFWGRALGNPACAGRSTRSSTASPTGCPGISSRRRTTVSSATAWTSSWPPTSCSS